MDSALITCVAIFLSKMAIQKTEDSIYINTITSMLVVTITMLEFCGLVNTIKLYVAASFGNYGVYPLRVLWEMKNQWFEMIFTVPVC